MKPSQRSSTGRATSPHAQDDEARDLFDQLFTAPLGEKDLPGILLLVDIKRVHPREPQPRTHFDDEKLGELAQDIAELRARGGGVGGTGILQPLIVTPLDATGDKARQGTFAIVAGERRYRAALQSGCSQLPVIVREVLAGEGDEALWEDALRENIQRENLTPLEEALAIQNLAQRGQHSVRRLAQRLGKGKGYVEQRLALARAGADVQEMVSRRQDTISVAREIEKVKDGALRARLIEMAQAGAPVARLREHMEKARRDVPAQVANRPSVSGAKDASSSAKPSENPPQDAHSTRHQNPDPAPRPDGQTLCRMLQAMAGIAQEAQTMRATAILSPSERQDVAEQIQALEEALASLKSTVEVPSTPQIPNN